MVSQIIKSFLLVALLLSVTSHGHGAPSSLSSSFASSPESGDEDNGKYGFNLKGEDFFRQRLPEMSKMYHGTSGGGGMAQKSPSNMYIDPSSYYFPRFVVEQDYFPAEQELLPFPSQTKRASKGMCE
jgi:hypothetical protein